MNIVYAQNPENEVSGFYLDGKLVTDWKSGDCMVDHYGLLFEALSATFAYEFKEVGYVDGMGLPTLLD
jgi:hypothetical protein